ncbi:hypothetical protein ALC62_12085, partial [Cyphomyrmex costatus]
ENERAQCEGKSGYDTFERSSVNEGKSRGEMKKKMRKRTGMMNGGKYEQNEMTSAERRQKGWKPLSRISYPARKQEQASNRQAGCRVRKTERAEASRRARERDGEHAAPACLILESELLIRNPGSQSRARRRYKPFAGHGYDDGRRPGLRPPGGEGRTPPTDTLLRKPTSQHPRGPIPAGLSSLPCSTLDRTTWIILSGSSVIVFALPRSRSILHASRSELGKSSPWKSPLAGTFLIGPFGEFGDLEEEIEESSLLG